MNCHSSSMLCYHRQQVAGRSRGPSRHPGQGPPSIFTTKRSTVISHGHALKRAITRRGPRSNGWPGREPDSRGKDPPPRRAPIFITSKNWSILFDLYIVLRHARSRSFAREGERIEDHWQRKAQKALSGTPLYSQSERFDTKCALLSNVQLYSGFVPGLFGTERIACRTASFASFGGRNGRPRQERTNASLVGISIRPISRRYLCGRRRGHEISEIAVIMNRNGPGANGGPRRRPCGGHRNRSIVIKLSAPAEIAVPRTRGFSPPARRGDIG